MARKDWPGLVRRDEVSLLRRLQASLVELSAQGLHLWPLATLHGMLRAEEAVREVVLGDVWLLLFRRRHTTGIDVGKLV